MIMENKFLLALITFFVTFAFVFVNLSNIGKSKASENKKDTLTYVVSFSVFAIASTILTFCVNKIDFLYDFNPFEFIFVLIATIAIFLMHSLEKTKKLAWLSTVVFGGAIFFFIPEFYNLFTNRDLLWLSNIIIIAAFITTSLIFKYINGLEGILTTQIFFIGVGIFLLLVLNAVPVLIGLIAVALSATFGALTTFNTYPARLKISSAAANSFGFLVCWLLLKTGQEASMSCSIIISIFFITEGIVAVLKKLTLLEKYENAYTNTFFYQAHIKGLSINLVNNAIIKISLLMLIFTCLQVYSPNYISIPVFSFLIMAWFLGKLLNWDVPKQTFKEMNKEFLNDLKDNISEAKKFINKD